MRRSQRNQLTQPNHITLPGYDEICLVLQGGGALGSYQAGVFEGLAEAGVEPTWTAGISIGALNTAIIAGNAPQDRVAALRGFWSTICQPADVIGHMGALWPAAFGFANLGRKFSSMWAAARALTEGQKGLLLAARERAVSGRGRVNEEAAERGQLLRHVRVARNTAAIR
jgi:NTE family protein